MKVQKSDSVREYKSDQVAWSGIAFARLAGGIIRTILRSTVGKVSRAVSNYWGLGGQYGMARSVFDVDLGKEGE